MSLLSPLARSFINEYQGGFPLVERPYLAVAGALGSTEPELLDLVRALLDAGYLSRFGPLYDAARLGGAQTLAALAVPEERFTEVAETVNAIPAIAHNYRREHRLNMWFVAAAPTAAGVAEALDAVRRRTGLPVHDFPKQHEFYIGLWLRLGGGGEVTTVPAPRAALRPAGPLDPLDLRIVAATQQGWPLVPEPYAALAEALGEEPGLILRRLKRLLASGAIRRSGAVPNHYRLGLRANGMTVWDLPDERAVELGERVGALDFVSHCYLRPRAAGVWPYNLFAMVHGRQRSEVLEKTELIAEVLGPAVRAADILFSTQILKKTGLRLAA
jgi:DNA-binding Lrp family transcriptional regulator